MKRQKPTALLVTAASLGLEAVTDSALSLTRPDTSDSVIQYCDSNFKFQMIIEDSKGKNNWEYVGEQFYW